MLGNSKELIPEHEELLKLVNYKMPFGKFKGTLLIDLPEPYIIWFANAGFPKGELGKLLGIVHAIKVNGLENLFNPLR
ncbi:MAG TPA: hypothetical protein EYH20_01850 [Leucothrix sp.]|nr:hypothetical protein [Leucothrix sp.]